MTRPRAVLKRRRTGSERRPLRLGFHKPQTDRGGGGAGKGEVAETDIGKVKVNLPARITSETYKDKVFNGKVYKIAPLGKEKENVTSFEVRVSVDNPEGLLLANMSANAELILEEHKNVLTVPEGAIFYAEKRQTFVEVPDPGSETGRKRVPVKIDIATGTKAEVVSGLKEGDKVILQ